MSQSYHHHQGIYNFPNAYERSTMIREEGGGGGGVGGGGFEALPPPASALDAGGMMTEIMNLAWRKPGGDALDDQIQQSYSRLLQKQQSVNGPAEEVCISYKIYKYISCNNNNHHVTISIDYC